MKLIAFLWVAAFLYQPSLASAMGHLLGVEFSSPSRLELFGATITAADFPSFFQKSDFDGIEQLEISHSKIDPDLFGRLSPDLKRLSMKKVQDLNGNVLSVHQFLENAAYFENLKSLTLDSQYIDDSAVSLIVRMKKLRKLNLPNNHITGKGFLEILGMEGLEILCLSHNQIGSFELKKLSSVRIKELILENNHINSEGAFSIANMQEIEMCDLIFKNLQQNSYSSG